MAAEGSAVRGILVSSAVALAGLGLLMAPHAAVLAQGAKPAASAPASLAAVVASIGHQNWVRAARFSPDGRLVVTGSDDMTIKLWDASTGRVLRTIEAGARVGDVAFSPDGWQIISPVWGDSVKVWDVESGRLLRTFRNVAPKGRDGDAPRLLSAAFMPDGATVLAAGQTSDSWSHLTGERIPIEDPALRGLYEVRASPDGRRMFGLAHEPAGAGLAIHVWEPDGRKLVRRLKADGTVLAISHDGRSIITGATGQPLHVWETSTGRLLSRLELGGVGSAGEPFAAFLPDGRRALGGYSASFDVAIWDVRTGRQSSTLAVPDTGRRKAGEVKLEVAADGRRALATHGSQAHLWNLETGELSAALVGATAEVPVAISGSGLAIAAGGDRTPLRAWNTGEGRLYPAFDPALRQAGTDQAPVALSHDGAYLVTRSPAGELKLWSVREGALLRTWTGVDSDLPASAVDVLPDGRTMIGGTKLELWDTAANRRLHTLSRTDDPYYAKVVALSGPHVFAAAWGAPPRLWDTRTGRELKVFKGDETINAAAFSPDARRLATAHHECTVKLWEVPSGKLVRELAQSRSAGRCSVRSVGFSADGRKLVSGGHSEGLSSGYGEVEQTIKLWDVATGRLERTFAGHASGISRVRITTSGERIVSASFDGTVRMWNIKDRGPFATFLFNQQGEWLLLAREGYYIGSDGGEQLATLVRGTDGQPLQQLRSQLRDPRMIELLFSGAGPGSNRKAATRPNLETSRPQR